MEEQCFGVLVLNVVLEKTRFVSNTSGRGIGSTLGEMALEGVTMHTIPWLGKKSSRNASVWSE